MPFSEFELKRIERDVRAYVEKKRPPPHIRPELDIGFRVQNQSVEIFEIRPSYQDPTLIIEREVAKATYVKTQGCWKIYWMRADLKWHSYKPRASVKHLAEFLEELETDRYACFWG